MHKMQLAKVGTRYARQHGLNPNHHARVWCTCMDHPQFPPGTFSNRPTSVVEADPRRLGSFDALGVVDLRVPDSAVELFRSHVRLESEK